MNSTPAEGKYSRKGEFFLGMRDTVPLLVGALPFGLIYGALAITAGLTPWAAQAMSLLVFAGSAQFIAAGLFAAGAPGLIIVLTTLVVNLRHMLYSATLLPDLKHLPLRWRLPLSFWLTDETFAVSVSRWAAEDNSRNKRYYQLGSSLAMYLNWQLCTFIGLAAGKSIPGLEGLGLDVAMPVTFIGMTIPFVRNIPMVICVVTAGASALLFYPLPYNLGLIIAAFLAIGAGTGAERLRINIKKGERQ